MTSSRCWRHTIRTWNSHGKKVVFSARVCLFQPLNPLCKGYEILRIQTIHYWASMYRKRFQYNRGNIQPLFFVSWFGGAFFRMRTLFFGAFDNRFFVSRRFRFEILFADLLWFSEYLCIDAVVPDFKHSCSITIWTHSSGGVYFVEKAFAVSDGRSEINLELGSNFVGWFFFLRFG